MTIRSLLFAFLPVLCLVTTAPSLRGADWIAPPTEAAVANPIPDGPAERKEGGALFSQYCASCHGTSGKGDGTSGIYLTSKPGDFTDPALSKQSDGELFWKITVGRNPMPPYKGNFTEAQRWKIVRYLRTFAPKPPLAAVDPQNAKAP